MNKQYKPIDTSKREVTNNLFEFDAIVDTDLASIIYILSRKPDKSLIKDEIFLFKPTINGFKNLLLSRENPNPLSILIKDEYKDSINDIYKELLMNHKQEIVDMSEVTDLFKFLVVSSETKGLINNTINCIDDIEKNYIRKLGVKVSIVNDEKDMNKYNDLFVKYAGSLLKYENLDKKHIFLFNAKYNMMKQINIFKPEVMLLSEKNIINVVDPYKGLTIPTEDIEKWLQLIQKDTEK